MQVYYSARATLSRLTAGYDARSQEGTDEGSLKDLLAARIAYDDASQALEIHEKEHGCAGEK